MPGVRHSHIVPAGRGDDKQRPQNAQSYGDDVDLQSATGMASDYVRPVHEAAPRNSSKQEGGSRMKPQM